MLKFDRLLLHLTLHQGGWIAPWSSVWWICTGDPSLEIGSLLMMDGRVCILLGRFLSRPRSSRSCLLMRMMDQAGKGGYSLLNCTLTYLFGCSLLTRIINFLFLLQEGEGEGERIQSGGQVCCTCWPTSSRTLFDGEASWGSSGSSSGSRHCSAWTAYS